MRLILSLIAIACGHAIASDMSMPPAQGSISSTPIAAPAPSSTTAPKLPPKSGAKSPLKTPPVRDRLEVNPQTAIKATPAKEITLPGVLKIDGESQDALDPTKAIRIQLDGLGKKVAYVSAKSPNHLVLPFTDPTVTCRDTLDIRKRPISNHVYISFISQDKEPEDCYFETPDATGPVLDIQFVPKAIPGRTIIVEDVAPGSRGKDGPKSNDYVSKIQYLTELVASGGIPSGYSAVDLGAPPIIKNGLFIKVGKKLSNRLNDVYVYEVTNQSTADIYVQEEEFDGDLVAAVSIFPTPALKPGQSSRVVVVSRKRGG